ncbi:hypothetical protein [Marinobacter subterrani]|uniref:hypothetical protein n=1 Tax=Marinobacter subterrani TaxID=1658765 RepID=UPI002353F1B9|nr:hypothetical protein [Marinobacter subterrani]
MKYLKRSTLIFTATMALSGPTQTQACSCIAAATAGATQISGLVGAGSTAVTQALFTGFQHVGSTVEASTGQQTDQLIGALDALRKNLVTEIKALPAYEQEMESNLDRLHPARHATSACTLTDRAGDMIATERLAALQETALNETSVSYNKMTSSYPEGTNASDRFIAKAGQLLRNRPEIKTAGMNWIDNADSFGALSPEQLQEGATFINLTTNPNPPAKNPKPSTPVALNHNTKVDLYNLRMSIPQSVQNQLLAYEAPVISKGQDSWLGEQLARISRNSDAAFSNGDAQISKSDLLQLMSTYRVKDAGWVTNLSAKDSEGAIKDLALAKADALAMEYELWLQDRNTALLLSQLLAAQNRMQRDDL